MKLLRYYISIIYLLLSCYGFGQVGVNTYSPDSSAALHVVSPDSASGILIPQMTNIQARSINSAATALMVYDKSNDNYIYFNGSSWNSFGTIEECVDNTCIATPAIGDMLFNSTTGFLEIFDGSTWQILDVTSNSFAP